MAQQCQFCGFPLGKNFVRPPDAYRQQVSMRKTWQEIAYTCLAVYWILYGGYQLAEALNVVPNIWFAFGGAGYIGTIGGAYVLIGIGLLTEQIWAQFLVKIFCWIGLPFHVLQYMWVFALKHPGALILTNTWQILLYALQLYVIAVVGDA